ncbi:hypothetical protein QFZ76_005146 [Streptomyces sp. V4I2]|nr:hypothetical protein [Streptomyces sp. V4I2]
MITIRNISYALRDAKGEMTSAPSTTAPDRGTCRCGTQHTPEDPALGTALDPATYDYAAAVLFNNHAGNLWMRFTTRLRREIAARAGLTRREDDVPGDGRSAPQDSAGAITNAPTGAE